VPAIKFDPEVCASCESVDCLMQCQYLVFKDVDEARAEKLKINDGRDSRVLHECLTCYACQEYCPSGNNPFYLLVERQEELGILPAPRPIIAEQLKMMGFKGRLTKVGGEADRWWTCAPFPCSPGASGEACLKGPR
jgi:Fe-S oxidoreductase